MESCGGKDTYRARCSSLLRKLHYLTAWAVYMRLSKTSAAAPTLRLTNSISIALSQDIGLKVFSTLQPLKTHHESINHRCSRYHGISFSTHLSKIELNCLPNNLLGRVGSAALAACLHKKHTVTAFLRNPSLLSPSLLSHPRLRIIQGEPTSHSALVEALRDQDSVIQASVYGNPSSHTESEKLVRSIIDAVKEVQAARARRIRLWVMSGQVMVDIPVEEEGEVYPIHPEHYWNYGFLREGEGEKDVDWSLLCPQTMEGGEMRVWLYNIR